MYNFESNQTLINEITPLNHVAENLKKCKILDLYLRKLLAEQDKYNTISLSCHEQVCLSVLHFERYFSHLLSLSKPRRIIIRLYLNQDK